MQIFIYNETLVNAGAVRIGRQWKIGGSVVKDGLKNDERIVFVMLDELAKSTGWQFYLKAHSLM